MKIRMVFILSLTIVALLVTGCGPSPEEIATQTAAAWTATPTPTNTPTPTTTPTPTPIPTSTPTPTPTPTPIPYDLAVHVMDAGGNPISGAVLALAELGEGEFAEQMTDTAGEAYWGDLPSDTITLVVAANGYFPAEAVETIERGPNELTVTLESDPSGLLPLDACAPGETLLYIEDFQDGYAQGWGEITAAIDFAAPNGWAITPNENGNTILTASQAMGFAIASLQDYTFEDAVWRLKLKVTGRDTDMFLNWRQGENNEGDWRYIVQLGGDVMIDLSRLQNPEPGHFSVGMTSAQMAQDRWYYFELGTYEGVTDLWVDGRRLASYTDPQPLPGGRIGLEVHLFENAETIFYFDDIAVCELNAPFETTYTSEPSQ